MHMHTHAHTHAHTHDHAHARAHAHTHAHDHTHTHVYIRVQVEAALTHAGLMCIAAGAIGPIHKSYFAAQLRGGGEWLMLELVVYWESGYRAGSP